MMITTVALGTADELPAEYRERLADLNVLPAWTLLRAVMPVGKPMNQARSFHWSYRALRDELLRAGELVPVEKAERRVLALVNPGLSAERMATLPSIFFGLQLIKPGERAPRHRHIPAAARIIVEGKSAYTTVEGEKIPMETGDIILTPPNHWHDHGHEGRDPMIWMDVLDHPLAVPLEISYVVPGELADAPSNAPDASETYYRCSGLVPYREPGERRPDYPLRRFQWKRVRDTLAAVADASDRSSSIHLRYVNPETGDTALKSLDMSARLLRPAETIRMRRSSANRVFHTLEGDGDVEVNGTTYHCEHGDTVAVPTYASVALQNASGKSPWTLIQVDDLPMQIKLGFYEEPTH
jgi:gentisate 1,2-dioxygenase